MHRVVGRLAAGLQQPDEAVDVPGRSLDRAEQVVAAEVHRAGAGHQQAVALEQAQRQLVQLR